MIIYLYDEEKYIDNLTEEEGLDYFTIINDQCYIVDTSKGIITRLISVYNMSSVARDLHKLGLYSRKIEISDKELKKTIGRG